MAADANRHAVLPTRPTARILPAAEARAWQDGFVLLETARREAQQTRDRARHAYASEYARGYDDGKAAGDADAARLVAETVAKVDHYLAGLKAEVAGLAVDIVKRVLGEFEVSDLVAHAADRAIADIRRARFIRLSIHPDVLDAVRSRLGPMLENNRFGFAIEVRADGELAPGACIVTTDFAVVDASVDTQIDTISAILAAEDEERQ